MIYWLVDVELNTGDTYRCVVRAATQVRAEVLALDWYEVDGEEPVSASAVEFNSFEHGDITHYNLLA